MATSVSASRPAPAARPPRQPLTDRHRAVWEFIAGRLAARGASPSYREVMAAFGIASPNGLAGHLDAIVKKGWLEVGSAMEARSLHVHRHLGEPEDGKAEVTAEGGFDGSPRAHVKRGERHRLLRVGGRIAQRGYRGGRPAHPGGAEALGGAGGQGMPSGRSLFP
jgi:hypothetical protein